MSLISQTFFTNTNRHFTPPLKTPLNLSLKNFTHFHILRTPSPNPNNIFTSLRTNPLPLKAFSSDTAAQRDGYGASDVKFDAFLSTAEFICLGSSAIVSIGFAVNCAVSGTQKVVNVWLGNRVLVWQVVVLVVGIASGAWLRRRQWRRICREEDRGRVGSVNLVGRIEKLEEDLRSSATIIRALSRHLEKLGIRFRLTRKSLKEPIAETAALAQKNSEATRALAVQEDILERELGEIQKVLLAMQEQQQKQLELILAVAKAGKLYDNRQRPNKEEDKIEPHNSAKEGMMQKGLPLVQTVVRHQETNNDRA